MAIHTISFADVSIPVLYRFSTRLNSLILKSGAEELGIERPYNKLFVPAFAKLDDVHTRTRASSFTGKIEDKEKMADNTISSIFGVIEIGLKSNDSETVSSAKNLKFELKKYKGLANQPRKKQVANTTSMLQDCKGKCAADVEKLGLGKLVTELEELNNDIDAYENERMTENAEKWKYGSAEAKKGIVDAFRAMCKTTEVLILTEGDAKYAEFIRNLNQLIREFGGARGAATDNDGRMEADTPTDNDENKYPDAKEWEEDLPFMGVENGDIYYILVSGKKVFYKLVDKSSFFDSPDSEKGKDGWEKL